jgi:hypothetical protein
VNFPILRATIFLPSLHDSMEKWYGSNILLACMPRGCYLTSRGATSSSTTAFPDRGPMRWSRLLLFMSGGWRYPPFNSSTAYSVIIKSSCVTCLWVGSSMSQRSSCCVRQLGIQPHFGLQHTSSSRASGQSSCRWPTT